METAKTQIIDVKGLLSGDVIPMENAETSTEEAGQQSDYKEVIRGQTLAIEEEKTEINQEEIVLNYLKEKGKQINSIDELFREPTTKEINLYEGLLDEQDKAYLEFKRENPNKTRRDFDSIYSDVEQISPLEFARERVLQESGVRLTNEQIDQYLEEELNVTLSEGEVSAIDLVKLSKYGKPIKDQRIEEQKQYTTSAIDKQKDNSIKEEQNNNNSDYVRLDNNTIMLKSDYDRLVANHQDYLKNNREAVDGVTDSVFSVAFDDNGEKQVRTYRYEYDQKDRHSMVSLTSDVQKMVSQRYRSEKGFDHKQFNEDLFWLQPENRSKAIGFIVQKARAEAIEEVLKNRGNFSFTPTQSLTVSGKEGVKNVAIKDIFN